MKENFKYWWLVLIKGIILIVLALFVFRHPVGALVGLTLYIGITLLFTGIFLIIAALSLRKSEEDWGWRLAEGILDVLFAFILLSNPGVTAAVFPFVVGFWVIFSGILIFVGSFKAKREGAENWWMGLIGGILTVILGYLITSNLVVGAIAITFWIGLGLLIFGILNISLSLRMRKISKTMT
jgi:uncharacterized membrane protein HdeD (DUF308 family)